MQQIQLPLFNHTKESCVICNGKHDEETTEFSPDWYTYMCVECMHKHILKWTTKPLPDHPTSLKSTMCPNG